MTNALIDFVTRELEGAVSPNVSAVAAQLASDLDGIAVLFYGSTLRTGDLSGILDFYVLTSGPGGSALRRGAMRRLWPDVSFHEVRVESQTLRAKVATLPIATFERAARGRSLDSTVWTRFVQRTALVWRADSGAGQRTARAVADAAVTAGRFAAVLGPPRGVAQDFWLALFRRTYRLELRVEPTGREAEILRHEPERYATLLPIAWSAAGIDYRSNGSEHMPILNPGVRSAIQRDLRRHARAGKMLNVARLLKASFTFEGAARYGAWKIHRHTGRSLELTPWRERHPILAAVGVLWQVLRTRAS